MFNRLSDAWFKGNPILSFGLCLKWQGSHLRELFQPTTKGLYGFVFDPLRKKKTHCRSVLVLYDGNEIGLLLDQDMDAI